MRGGKRIFSPGYEIEIETHSAREPGKQAPEDDDPNKTIPIDDFHLGWKAIPALSSAAR
jgi:hypothetical protein